MDVRTLTVLMILAVICTVNIAFGLIATEGQVFNTGVLYFIAGGFAAGIGCAIGMDSYTQYP